MTWPPAISRTAHHETPTNPSLSKEDAAQLTDLVVRSLKGIFQLKMDHKLKSTLFIIRNSSMPLPRLIQLQVLQSNGEKTADRET